jgi:hypothetical protein
VQIKRALPVAQGTSFHPQRSLSEHTISTVRELTRVKLRVGESKMVGRAEWCRQQDTTKVTGAFHVQSTAQTSNTESKALYLALLVLLIVHLLARALWVTYCSRYNLRLTVNVRLHHVWHWLCIKGSFESASYEHEKQEIWCNAKHMARRVLMFLMLSCSILCL